MITEERLMHLRQLEAESKHILHEVAADVIVRETVKMTYPYTPNPWFIVKGSQ